MYIYAIYCSNTWSVFHNNFPKIMALLDTVPDVELPTYIQSLRGLLRDAFKNKTLLPKIPYTGWSDRLGLKDRAAVSLFWDFWCPYRLPCHPKTGSKFPVGQIHSLMGFTVSQIGDCLKEEFQDLVILAQCTGCLISKISPSCMKYLCHKLYQFKFS